MNSISRPLLMFYFNSTNYVTARVTRFYCKEVAFILKAHENKSCKTKEDEVRTRRFIIDSQVSLRKDVQGQGDKFAEKLWQLRMQDKKHLEEYAANMFELSTNIWNRCKKMNLRISWTHDNIINYYNGKKNITFLKEEKRMLNFFPEFRNDFMKSEKFHDFEAYSLTTNEPLHVLDVGSCYNPFGIYERFQVTAIDICPAIPEVKECDFLTVKLKNKEDNSQIFKFKENSELAQNYCFDEEKNIKGSVFDFNNSLDGGKCENEKSMNCCNAGDVTQIRKHYPSTKIKALYRASFHAVIFCLFIGYIPSPRLRLFCCQKAYDLLMANGLLCIITPVSFFPHVNAHYADLWKLTLGHMGFHCIKCKEHKHFHGLIFRKGICKELFQIEAKRELEELMTEIQYCENEQLRMFKNFDYKSIFKNFYIHQDLLGLKDKVP